MVPLPNTIPYPSAQTGQLLNLSSSRLYPTNDTSNAGTLYLTTAKYGSTGVPALYPIQGDGTISFVISALKAQTTTTTNPTVTVTPQASMDGVIWATIPGITVATLTPTSATVPVTTMFEFTYNYAQYYRFLNSVTDTASVKSKYFFNKRYTISNR